MNKGLLLTLSVLIILSACTKKKPTAAEPDMADMLRTGKWKIAGGTFTKKLPIGSKDTTLQYLSFIPACHKDDYLVFDSGNHGAVYSGTTKCDASDADHIPFVWQLKNGNKYIDLYNGFNNLYTATVGILDFKFDTIYFDGTTLVLDTLIGAADTPLKGKVIVLDSNWKYQIFDTIRTPQISIYDAEITDFSQSSFNLHFSVITTYPDVRNSAWSRPQYLPDTMRYNVKYTNF